MGRRTRDDAERNIVYICSKRLSERIWEIVKPWGVFEKQEIGDSLIRSTDILKAAIAQVVNGTNAGMSLAAAKNARSALFEVRHWMKAAFRRGLLSEDAVDELLVIVEKLGPDINKMIDILTVRAKR